MYPWTVAQLITERHQMFPKESRHNESQKNRKTHKARFLRFSVDSIYQRNLLWCKLWDEFFEDICVHIPFPSLIIAFKKLNLKVITFGWLPL